MESLKESFFHEYGPADKRIKNPQNCGYFIVDDRNHGSYSADGRLFLWFCAITVAINKSQSIAVQFKGDIPQSDGVQRILGQIPKSPFGQQACAIEINPNNLSVLNELATELEKIVAPGKRYSVSSYKYVCPRTAKALRRLVKFLKGEWCDMKLLPCDQHA